MGSRQQSVSLRVQILKIHTYHPADYEMLIDDHEDVKTTFCRASIHNASYLICGVFEVDERKMKDKEENSNFEESQCNGRETPRLRVRNE